MESANLIELAVAFYKDKVQQELLEKFRVESRHLLQTDAETRRTMAREDIKAMAQLKIELEKFKYIYHKLTDSCGPVTAIDEYLKEIEMKVQKLSCRKNNIK